MPQLSNLTPSLQIQNTINSLCPPYVFNCVYSSINDFPVDYPCKIFDDPFTIQELNSAIRNLKILTSPGYDKIDNKMLSLLSDEYLPILLDIFSIFLYIWIRFFSIYLASFFGIFNSQTIIG